MPPFKPASKPPRRKPLVAKSSRHGAPRTDPRPSPPSAFEKAFDDLAHQPKQAFENVNPRWLLSAAGIVLLITVACGWLLLCFLYWQGSWQLLYHPRTAITRTPASVGLTYEPIRFGAVETGTPQLTGWWLPAQDARFTVLYLHGANGNLSDTVDLLAILHQQHLAVLAFDYRGYGQSATASGTAHPSEDRLRHDAEWALMYLTQTRHIAAGNILVYGTELGADLAVELAGAHGDLAGVMLDQPFEKAAASIFNDPRSRLVPARWLISDRYDLDAAARALRFPSLWLLPVSTGDSGVNQGGPVAPSALRSAHTTVWLRVPSQSDPHFSESLSRWLDELSSSSGHL